MVCVPAEAPLPLSQRSWCTRAWPVAFLHSSLNRVFVYKSHLFLALTFFAFFLCLSVCICLYNLNECKCSDCLNSHLILGLFYWLRCIMWFRSEVMAAILDFTSQDQRCSSIFLPDKSFISVISCQRPLSVSLIVYWISSMLKNTYFMPFREKHCCAFE